jgi:hypothetical protein
MKTLVNTKELTEERVVRIPCPLPDCKTPFRTLDF